MGEKGGREMVKAWNEEQVEEVAACVQMGVGVKQKGKDYNVFSNSSETRQNKTKQKWIYSKKKNKKKKKVSVSMMKPSIVSSTMWCPCEMSSIHHLQPYYILL